MPPPSSTDPHKLYLRFGGQILVGRSDVVIYSIICLYKTLNCCTCKGLQKKKESDTHVRCHSSSWRCSFANNNKKKANGVMRYLWVFCDTMVKACMCQFTEILALWNGRLQSQLRNEIKLSLPCSAYVTRVVCLPVFRLPKTLPWQRIS